MNDIDLSNTPLRNHSSLYYAVDLSVEPYDSGNGPIIQNGLYDYIDNVLYRNTDAPIWMRRTDGPQFRVSQESAMPQHIIGMSKDFIRQNDVIEDGYRGAKTFLIKKPQSARYLSQSLAMGEKYITRGELNAIK